MATNPPADSVRDGLMRRVHWRTAASGQLNLPAVPAMLDEYVSMCANVFANVGRRFSDDERAHLRSVLEGELAQAFSGSSRSHVVVSYNAPIASALDYHVKPEWWSVEGAYENWVATREPPLFGTEPDARVWALAHETAEPWAHPVLDIGGGTGRNALALARRGHPVDVVEMTPRFAEQIRTEAADGGLNVRVIQRDVFTTVDDLRRDYALIVLSEVVSDFRSTQQVRGIFELATQCLDLGGQLVFNVHLARNRVRPRRCRAAIRAAGLHVDLHQGRASGGGVGPAVAARRRRLRARLRASAPSRGVVAADRLVRQLGQRARRLRGVA